MLLWTYSFCIQMLSLYQVLMQERRNLFYQVDDNGVIFQADGESSKESTVKESRGQPIKGAL